MKYYCDNHRHLVCMPYSIRNLHTMALKLGLKPSWFHKNHYDIPKRRMEEIKSMCIQVSSKDIVRIINGDFDPVEVISLPSYSKAYDMIKINGYVTIEQLEILIKTLKS